MLLLSGARQVGKTTIYRQTIKRLLETGFPAVNIIYATFDHPILKLAGIERTKLGLRDGNMPSWQCYPLFVNAGLKP